MKFDEIDDDEIEGAARNTVDFGVRMGRHGDDATDYPQNPYGDRTTKSESLFFDDLERSVDFVVVWKKLVPSSDDERSDALKEREMNELTKKESERTMRREVFEENLIIEGLELEREVVDDEIHFVKIHAPLEVLRRYAEILKLRLPMKEVSKLC